MGIGLNKLSYFDTSLNYKLFCASTSKVCDLIGLKDLWMGYKNCQQSQFDKGRAHLAKGAVRLGITITVVAGVVLGIKQAKDYYDSLGMISKKINDTSDVLKINTTLSSDNSAKDISEMSEERVQLTQSCIHFPKKSRISLNIRTMTKDPSTEIPFIIDKMSDPSNPSVPPSLEYERLEQLDYKIIHIEPSSSENPIFQADVESQRVLKNELATNSPPLTSVMIDEENPIPDLGFIPAVNPSQIKSNFNPSIRPRKVVLLTAYDSGIKEYADHVIPNQRAYAAKQGYDYHEYQGNLAHDDGVHRAPYWSKIVALNDQLEKTKEGDWIAWTDASAIFTNTEKNFDEIIDKYGADKDIILTKDPQVPINNAVFLIKNSPFTKEWIQKVWSREDLAIGGQGNCWSWGNPFCHYEQQAMTELHQSDSRTSERTVIIGNKLMNAFYRYSHYDPFRDMEQNYDSDKEDTKWSPGDFICKITGMDKALRYNIIKHVVSNCVDTVCQRLIFRRQNGIITAGL